MSEAKFEDTLGIMTQGEAVDKQIVWLSKTELFSKLKKDELTLLSHNAELLTLDAGQVVFRPGEPGDSLFVVGEGSVDVFGEGEGGPLLAELIAPDVFGETELLTGKFRNALAMAASPVRLLRFPGPGKTLGGILESRPDIGTQVLAAFQRTVAGRLRKANQLIKENSALVQELRRQVYGDKLTGLYNKTYLEETLPGLLGKGALSLFLMKPDNFKAINDTFGHEAGDETLRRMAIEVARFSTDRGFALKYMGNELGIVLPGCDRNNAKTSAQELLGMLRELDLAPATNDSDIRLSISLGIAVHPEHGADAESLIAAAHALPLVGRSRGGNLILFPEEVS